MRPRAGRGSTTNRKSTRPLDQSISGRMLAIRASIGRPRTLKVSVSPTWTPSPGPARRRSRPAAGPCSRAATTARRRGAGRRLGLVGQAAVAVQVHWTLGATCTSAAGLPAIATHAGAQVRQLLEQGGAGHGAQRRGEAVALVRLDVDEDVGRHAPRQPRPTSRAEVGLDEGGGRQDGEAGAQRHDDRDAPPPAACRLRAPGAGRPEAGRTRRGRRMTRRGRPVRRAKRTAMTSTTDEGRLVAGHAQRRRGPEQRRGGDRIRARSARRGRRVAVPRARGTGPAGRVAARLEERRRGRRSAPPAGRRRRDQERGRVQRNVDGTGSSWGRSADEAEQEAGAEDEPERRADAGEQRGSGRGRPRRSAGRWRPGTSGVAMVARWEAR